MNIETHPLEACLTAEGVRMHANQHLEKAKTLQKNIAALKEKSPLTWEETFDALDDLHFMIGEASSIPHLMAATHPDKEVRDAAREGEPKISAFITELLLDEDVFHVLERFEKQQSETEPSRLRFMRESLNEYRRNGLGLPKDKQQELKDLNKTLTDLGQVFDQNLAETLSIKIKPEQLVGLSEQYIAQHQPDTEGVIHITTDYPNLVPFMRDAKDRDAALELYTLNANRCLANLPLLKEMIALRRQKAALLGHSTWADYVLEPRMAKDAKTVEAFLNDLHQGLITPREKEFAIFDELAQRLELPHGNQLRASDSSYLNEKATQERFQLDGQILSQYFEVNAVKHGILRVIEDLYNVRFEEQPKQGVHPDIETYHVIDKGEVIGTLHLDLYPRPDKYKHMAVFGMRASSKKNGKIVLPICSLVCNFAQSKDGTPALLTHSDVETFFHEMGHAMHRIFGQTELASQSGTSVAWDFVEVPSQLFENWAWDRVVLDRFAKHHLTGETIPQDLFDALTASRNFGEATFTERQLFLATLDFTYHTAPAIEDTTKVYDGLYPQFSHFKRPENTHPEASFGHLNGYDAAYYGYQWALAIAHDVASRFFSEGLMNPATGAAYREAILSQGDSADGYALVERFLGRKPNNEAYKKYLGL
ncbi:MAG: Zn-dependent oligopeptidase [Candidatus Magasanikbacteria bacterium]|nr:Zn-dependent oligopeptidase [Candidatus Magasanikbacteria bacterium]